MSDNSRNVELHTMRELMKTPNGRNLMHRCLQNTQVNENIFDTNDRQHAYNEGKRDHGLWLQRELKEASTEYYLMMLKEHEL